MADFKGNAENIVVSVSKALGDEGIHFGGDSLDEAVVSVGDMLYIAILRVGLCLDANAPHSWLIKGYELFLGVGEID